MLSLPRCFNPLKLTSHSLCRASRFLSLAEPISPSLLAPNQCTASKPGPIARSMATAPESCVVQGISSAPANGQLIEHDSVTYKTVQEGQAFILTPQPKDTKDLKDKKAKKSEDKPQSVFYNPIQQFNRDLSVLAIRAYGEHVVSEKKRHRERQLSRRDKSRGTKRKREDAAKDTGSTEQERASTGATGEATSNESTGKPAADVAAAEAAEDEATSPKFTILDALSATGLRALRYAKEIPFASKVVANDLSASAIAAMKLNIMHNGVEDRVQPNKGDACAYMYKAATNDVTVGGKFDVVDLDPYGTAAPFMDAAVQAVSNGGLLCVTCTDAGVFASNGYPEKAFALYGGVTMKGPHSHEGGLRLILNALATSAAKYGLAIEPLLSLSIDFYARVFVRVHRSPAEVKFLASKTMVVYNCDSGCGAWKTQPLAAARQRKGKNDTTYYHYGYAKGPSAAPTCEHCGFKTHVVGPMWAGPLHNPVFIKRILDLLPGADKSTHQTTDRIEGMLSTALEEDLMLEEVTQTASTASDQAENGGNALDIPRTDPAKLEPYPFFFIPSFLCKVIHTSTMPELALRGAIKHLGYKSTRSHAKPGSIRTDAPWEVIWEIVREWARQKSPVREEAIRPGTAGDRILKKSREVINKERSAAAEATALRNELVDALEAVRGTDLSELRKKVEAALARTATSSQTDSDQAMRDVNEESKVKKSQPRAASRSRSPSPSRKPPLDPSSLEIVFDESLGRAALATQQKKRLTRYQINPRPNWGPMSRADID